MNQLQDNEFGYFVDSLTPHQRVFLQRLLGECLAACPRSEKAPVVDPEQVLGLMADSTKPLFDLLGLLRQFSANDSDSDIRPFALSIPEPGHAVIMVSPRILSWRGIWEAQSHEWLAQLRLGRLTVDVTRLKEDVNSATVAWLVTLTQHLPDKRLYLKGASTSLRRSIAVLHLARTLLITD